MGSSAEQAVLPAGAGLWGCRASFFCFIEQLEPSWTPLTCAQRCLGSRRFVAHIGASEITCCTPETSFGHH